MLLKQKASVRCSEITLSIKKHKIKQQQVSAIAGHFVGFTRRPKTEHNAFQSIAVISLLSSHQCIFSFVHLHKVKMQKKKATEWHNQLKQIENELKMNICLLALYLDHFEFIMERTLRKFFYIFYGIVKSICETSTNIFL